MPTINKIKRVRRALRKYQREALSYGVNRGAAAYIMQMRLGKSLVYLRSLAVKFSTPDRRLIVAPYSALYEWRKELMKEGVSKKDIGLVFGSRSERLEELEKTKEFFLINKEGWQVVPEIASYAWQSVCLDESPFIKNPKTKISNFFVNNFEHVSDKAILTGMPAPESDLDYFQQLQFLDKNIIGYKNYWDFRTSCFGQPFRGEYRLRKSGAEYFNKVLADNCFILNRKDVDLDVEKVITNREMIATIAQRKILQTLYREMIFETDSEFIKAIDNAGSIFSTARRVCGGFIEGQFVFDNKLKVLSELLNGELKNKQLIIFCEFRAEIQMISDFLTRKKISNKEVHGGNRKTRFETFDSFINGDTEVMVGNPECFKYGTDLSVCDTIIYYSLPMSNDTLSQSQERIISVINRIPAHLIFLTLAKTIEEEIFQSMIEKVSREQMRKRIVKRIQRESKR